MARLDDIPDLTSQLRDRGLLREYEQYRRQCQQHRQRLNHAASFDPPVYAGRAGQGERGLFRRMASNPSTFDEYYPTHRKFMWHHTAAYWTAVLFVQGSLLFTLAAAVEFFEESLHWHKDTVAVLTLWPNFVGGMMFLTGAYCSYLNLINMRKEPNEAIEYFIADWAKVRRNNSEVTSRVGTMAYFVGAAIFTVGVVFPILDLPWLAEYLLVTVPGFTGSVCFVVGGVCEMLHNGVLDGVFSCCLGAHAGDEAEEAVMGHRSTCRDPVWWVAVGNTVGGLNFLFTYVPGLLAMDSREAKVFGKLNSLVGSMVFIATSWLLVFMWKSNDFGLALLRQLNDAIGSGAAVARRRQQGGDHVVTIEMRGQVHAAGGGGEAEAEPPGERSMSLRGALFIGIYCWLCFASIVNTMLMVLWESHSLNKDHPLRFGSRCSGQLLVVLGVGLVLGLHSTVTSVPKEQPYHALVILSRFVLTLGAVGQTVSWFDFIQVPYDDDNVSGTVA